MDYTLIRSKRKSISLEVSFDLQVVVRAPLKAPKEAVDRFVKANARWIENKRKRLFTRYEKINTLCGGDLSKIKAYAKDYLVKRVNYFSDLTGLYPAGVKITSAQKRFGSCNRKNSLCFSAYLMGYDARAIDLVVAHELCHIRYKNHGGDFYRLLASIMPDYKERKELLR